MDDGCGASVYGLLRLSSQACLWQRTPPAFSAMMEAARSGGLQPPFKRRGMASSGKLSPLPISVPRTEETESSWWLGKTPAWVKCDHCEDYICTIHMSHAHECECPPIEEWEQSPYEPRVIWPTPTARDHKGPCWNTPARDCLDHAVERGETKTRKYPTPPGDGGRLNPTWVEWLMGFPPGWTDCGVSATPSCRKSRNGSADGSRKLPK